MFIEAIWRKPGVSSLRGGRYKAKIGIAVLTWAIQLTSMAAVPPVACLAPVANNTGDQDTGSIEVLHEVPGLGVLIRAEHGFFLVRVIDNKLSIKKIFYLGVRETGPVLTRVRDLPGAGTMFVTEWGVVLARIQNGQVHVRQIGDDATSVVLETLDVPGAGIVMKTERGLFLPRLIDGKLRIQPADIGDTGQISDMVYFPSAMGALIQAEKGLFFLRTFNDKLQAEFVGNVDFRKTLTRNFSTAHGLVALAEKDSFIVRNIGGKIDIHPIGQIKIGKIQDAYDLPGIGLLIGSADGLFVMRLIDGKVSIAPASTEKTGPVFNMISLPGIGILLRGLFGLFVVRPDSENVVVERLDTGYIGLVQDSKSMHGQAGTLIAAMDQLFVAKSLKGKTHIAPVNNIKLDSVNGMQSLPTGDVVIHTDNGLFLASPNGDQIFTQFIGTQRIRAEPPAARLANGDLLVGTDAGLFQLVKDWPDRARVELANRKQLERINTESGIEHNFYFTIAHRCNSVMGKLGLRLLVKDPAGRKTLIEPDNVILTTTPDKSRITVRLVTDMPGTWTFQFATTQGGAQRMIGPASEFVVAPVDWWERVKQWGPWLSGALTLTLALSNIVLFVAARRYPWAWRLATDDRLGTIVLRFATILLSHVQKAQLWILDLFFQKYKGKLPPALPFLPLPLDHANEGCKSSDEVIMPWANQHLWIQGNSGMGKTALFRHVVDMHFRGHTSSFDAFQHRGCILVAFSARDFADGSEDRLEPDWVVNGIKGILTQSGLSFDDNKALLRILQSGTIGVAIDSLHEAGRTMAVDAFIRAYPAVRMLVTSQELGNPPFSTWRLPGDMRAFISDLLKLHLTLADAAIVMERITRSGLKNEIRSGYDVRLIIDLVRADPAAAPLPSDRAGLYAAVVDAAWPSGSVEVRTEQQLRTAAAAWMMVSERKPHEDMRRMHADDGLGSLLETLAATPEQEGKTIRLVRRVGGAFEFVHDQMHAYLAARWFTQEGLTIQALIKMLETSAIWTQPVSARRTLWSFVAALLDGTRLHALWDKIEDNEEWDSLRRELKHEAEVRGLVPVRDRSSSEQ